MLIVPMGHRSQDVGQGGVDTSVYRPISQGVHTWSAKYVPGTHTAVGMFVGEGVGATVVGVAVGCGVGIPVGCGVGILVGVGVGCRVGCDVGNAVGCGVGSGDGAHEKLDNTSQQGVPMFVSVVTAHEVTLLDNAVNCSRGSEKSTWLYDRCV